MSIENNKTWFQSSKSLYVYFPSYMSLVSCIHLLIHIFHPSWNLYTPTPASIYSRTHCGSICFLIGRFCKSMSTVEKYCVLIGWLVMFCGSVVSWLLKQGHNHYPHSLKTHLISAWLRQFLANFWNYFSFKIQNFSKSSLQNFQTQKKIFQNFNEFS